MTNNTDKTDRFEEEARKLLTRSETEDLRPPFRCLPPPDDAWLRQKINLLAQALRKQGERIRELEKEVERYKKVLKPEVGALMSSEELSNVPEIMKEEFDCVFCGRRLYKAIHPCSYEDFQLGKRCREGEILHIQARLAEAVRVIEGLSKPVKIKDCDKVINDARAFLTKLKKERGGA